MVSLVAHAQQLGDFKLTNVMNNRTISLSDYASSQGLLIIFTSGSCPYDEYYRKRIAKVADDYRDRIPVILVNASPDEASSPEKMAARGKELNFSVPYLADTDQTLMAQLGARKTPEAFLFRKEGGKFNVVYRGAIDDNPQVEADVRHHYLRNAIDTMLGGGRIELPEARPVGCNLKRK